ncbi:alanine racemase [Bacillus carboniphilus]|uniref:Alanine racemase n=1 Tax=Bacillus carboniphilus TaxID=86663 RepID=A0ABN0W0P5_9BACI
MGFYRDTWAEINLDAINWNVTQMKNFLPTGTELMAVVKANAYGHGDVQVAQTALESGADFIAVAILDEAIALRQKGVKAPILVLGATRPTDVQVASDYNISLTVFKKDWLLQAKSILNPKQFIKIHIKADTGMGRLGIQDFEELVELIEVCKTSSSFVWEGLFTHFATADQLEESYFSKQLNLFHSWVSQLDAKPPIIHISNSAAGFKENIQKYNAVRMGISMYGLTPSPEIKPYLPFELKPALSLYTKMVQVKQVSKGTAISYGNTYVAEEDEWIATLPIGYADGWIRKNQGHDVSVDGKRVPIIGRICMDQCMIKLPKYFAEGTVVSLIGDVVSMDEVADRLETINYEVACMISSRVPRIYIKNDQQMVTDNPILR